MNEQDRQAIEGVFSRLGELERQGVLHDPEADSFIQSRMQGQPGAAYFLAQTVVVQDRALQAAQARIAELEQRAGAGNTGANGAAGTGRGAPGALGAGAIGSASQDYAFGRQGAAPTEGAHASPATAAGLAQKLGFGKGGGAAAAQAAPAGNRGGMGGSGFLAGAMQTAMGVAGGMMLGNMLGGLFGGNDANAATPPDNAHGTEAADTTQGQDAQGSGYDESMGMDEGGGFDGGFDDF